MTIHILRSPESMGRPEKYIVDQVVDEMRQRQLPVFDHQFNAQTADPKNGQDFYSLDPAVVMMQRAASVIHDLNEGDTVFIADAQAPLAPVIRYMTRLKGISVSLVGLFHSSALTAGDLFYDSDEAEATEDLTLRCLDVALAATRYLADHLRTITKDRPEYATVVITHGLPVNHIPTSDGLPWDQRENVCVWPHRVAEDKGLDFMLQLATRGVNIRVLTPTRLDADTADRLFSKGVSIYHCETREEYFKQLGQAKIVLSTAILETFGYAMVEGALMGCIPIVPDWACYSEQYRAWSKYASPQAVDTEQALNECITSINEALIQTRATRCFGLLGQHLFGTSASRIVDTIDSVGN